MQLIITVIPWDCMPMISWVMKLGNLIDYMKLRELVSFSYIFWSFPSLSLLINIHWKLILKIETVYYTFFIR